MPGKSGAKRFSLILGTFGRTEELEHYLASLDAQSYRNFELIVLDQNPDDRLAPVLAPYEGRFAILRLRSEKGLSRANNLGLRHASGVIVGFPDDDCRYPPDLLGRVAQFFSDNPDAAGLCGRSVDSGGHDSNGRYDAEPGAVDRLTLWRRSVQYAVFLRVESVRGAWFDEDLGPGAGTAYWASDETDFLLQLLRRGATLRYDPTLTVIHPHPVKTYDQRARRRSYHYGCSMGRVLRKHRYPPSFVARMLFHPLRQAALALARLEPDEAGYRWSAFKGRVRGLLP